MSTAYFLNGQVGFLAGALHRGYAGYVVLSTRDGGATWNALLFGAAPPRLLDPVTGPGTPRSIDFADSTHGWIAIQGSWPGNGHLLSTRDGGRSWDAVSFASRERDSLHGRWVRFVTPTDGWSAGGSVRRLMRTQDAGRTWTPTVMLTGTLLFVTPSVGWVIGRSSIEQQERVSRIHHTRDGGVSWRAEYTPAPVGEDDFSMPFHVANERLWRLVYSPLTDAVWAVGKGGSAWLRANAPTKVATSGKLITLWSRLKQQGGIAGEGPTE